MPRPIAFWLSGLRDRCGIRLVEPFVPHQGFEEPLEPFVPRQGFEEPLRDWVRRRRVAPEGFVPLTVCLTQKWLTPNSPLLLLLMTLSTPPSTRDPECA